MGIHSEEMQPDASGFVQGVDRIGTPGEMLAWCKNTPLTQEWRKASFSNGSGGNNCVEVKLSRTQGWVMVRNSKDPKGGVLAFTSGEWTAFLAGARAGEFDL